MGIVEFLSPEDKHRAGGLQREFKHQKGEGPKLSDLSAGLFKISGSQWQAGNSCLINYCGEFSVKLLHQPLGHYDYSLSLCRLRRRQSSQTITTVIQEDTRWARRSLCVVSPCVCVFHFADEIHEMYFILQMRTLRRERLNALSRTAQARRGTVHLPT